MSTGALMMDPFVVNHVVGDRFLDVGCGRGKWGFLLKTHRLSCTGAPIYVAGVDLRRESIESSLARCVYDDLRVANATDLPYADKSFDSVIACEVIEHLPQEQGLRLVQEARRVARACVVVSTPHAAGLRQGYDSFENHLSSYTYREFSALGFTQIVGLGRLRCRSWKLSVCLAPLGLWFPLLSSHLMGFWFEDGRRRCLYAE